MTDQIGKNENDIFLHNLPNRNGKYLTDFSYENCLSCLTIKFQEMEGNL